MLNRITRLHIYVKKLLIVIGVMFFITLLVFAGYSTEGFGFGEQTNVSIATTVDSTGSKITTRTEEYQSGKTVWDWMELLIVPTILAVGGFLFSHSERKNIEITASQKEKIDREIAIETAKDIVLEAYFDRMSDLLLDKPLEGEQRSRLIVDIARARTLTTLQRLDEDGIRKSFLLEFLYESDLIKGDTPLISLSEANLSNITMIGVNLNGINFSGCKIMNANLYKCNLTNANLMGANLENSNLSKTILIGSNLTSANLQEANLEGAILRDTILNKAELIGANLGNADLTNARLLGSNLFQSRLRNSVLDNADMRECTVTESEIKKARSCKNTIMPSGIKVQ